MTIKHIFEDDDWQITKILNGGWKVRVDARTRHHIADGVNFVSEWCTKNYADKLAQDNYGKKCDEMNVWRD
jgi:hypothetical protein